MKRTERHSVVALGVLVVVAGLGAAALAQEQSGSTDKPVRTLKAPEEIFQEIMTTLSAENRARIDSASHGTARPPVTSEQASLTREQSNGEAVRQAARQEHLEQLPAGVREQVEKAIREMESANQERKVELKGLERRQ